MASLAQRMYQIPTFKIKVVHIEYWDCGNPQHQHQTEPVAAVCIAKTKARNGAHRWDKPALADLLKEYRSGKRHSDLARQLKLSNSRLSQLIKQAEFAEKPSQCVFDDLSVRTKNCLIAEGLRTTEEICEAFYSGLLPKLPNMGAVSVQEVGTWLEFV
jgi:hypothetical protein